LQVTFCEQEIAEEKEEAPNPQWTWLASAKAVLCYLGGLQLTLLGDFCKTVTTAACRKLRLGGK
jgi:hypothetical protein